MARVITFADIRQVQPATSRDNTVRRATGDDFGAQKARALAAFGNAIGNLGKSIGAQQAKLQGAEDNTYLTGLKQHLDLKYQGMFQDQQTAALEAGTTFSGSYQQNVEQSTPALVDEYIKTTGQRPSSLAREKEELIARDLQYRYYKRAGAYEFKTRVERLGVQLSASLNQASDSVLQTGDLESARQNGYEQLDALKGAFPPDKLDQAKTAFSRVIENNHAQYRINQGDFEGVKQDLQRVPKLPDLKINDIRSQNRREGRARSGQIKGVVFHHTAGSSMSGALEHGNKVGTGTHYYIDRDGSVHQFASDGTKMVHVREAISGYRTDKGKFKHLGNDSTIGVEIVARNAGDVTPKQRQAAAALAQQLSQKYKIDQNNVVSHADLQGGPGGNRQADEGRAAVESFRRALKAPSTKEGDQEGFVYEHLDAADRQKLLKQLDSRLEGKRFELKQKMSDDIESIRRTGQGVEGVDLETAGRVLEPNQLNRYRIQRDQAKYEYNALQSIPELRDDQLTERLNELEPKPGQDGYDFLSNVYDKAQKQVSKIRSLRSTDPAMAVAEFELVKEANKKLDPKDPATFVNLIGARLASQERIGIPESNQHPITKEEAKVILSPVKNLKGDDLVSGLKEVIEQTNQRYGRYGKQVFLSAVQHASRSDERAEIATGILEDYLSTGKVSVKKKAQSQELNQTDNIQKSIDPDLQAAEDEMLQMRLEQAPKEFMKPNKDHIEALKKNPDLADQFDDKFGPGMAAKILGGSK